MCWHTLKSITFIPVESYTLILACTGPSFVKIPIELLIHYLMWNIGKLFVVCLGREREIRIHPLPSIGACDCFLDLYLAYEERFIAITATRET